MSDGLSPEDPGPRRAPEPRPEVRPDLSDLQARLESLQRSVESLGASSGWDAPPPPPPPAGWHGSPAGYAVPPPPPPAHAPYEPQTDYGAAPLPPAPAPADPYAPPPPAATNGHSEAPEDPAEVSARWATVAIVEAGPFADLIELRHFEDDLASLNAVSDVRVRRFGHGRATIEVGMTGPYPLARELYQINRPMELSDGPEGEVVIELAPAPAPPAAEPADEPLAEPPAEHGEETR